jgi:hypothetical protein
MKEKQNLYIKVEAAYLLWPVVWWKNSFGTSVCCSKTVLSAQPNCPTLWCRIVSTGRWIVQPERKRGKEKEIDSMNNCALKIVIYLFGTKVLNKTFPFLCFLDRYLGTRTKFEKTKNDQTPTIFSRPWSRCWEYLSINAPLTRHQFQLNLKSNLKLITHKWLMLFEPN